MPTGSHWFRDSYRFENGFRRTTLARIELATLRSYDFFGALIPELAATHRNIEIRDIDQLIASCKAFLQADGFWEEFAFCFDAICHFAKLYFALFRERQKQVPGLPEDWDPDLFDDAAKRRNNARRRREERDSRRSEEPNWDAYHANFRQDGGAQANQSPNNVGHSVVTAPSTVIVVKNVLKPVHGVFMINLEKEVIAMRYDMERHCVEPSLFLEDGIVSAHKDAPVHRVVRKMRKRQVPMDIENWEDFMHEEEPDSIVNTNSVVVQDMETEDVRLETESIDQLGSVIFGDDYRGRDMPSDFDVQPHLMPIFYKQPKRPESGPRNNNKSVTSNFDVSRDATQDVRFPEYSAQPGRPYVFPLPSHRTCDVGVIAKRSDRSKFSRKKKKQSSFHRSAKYLERSRSYSWLRRFRAKNVFNN